MSVMTVLSVGGYIGLIVSAVFLARSRVPAQTIENYEKLAQSQERRINDLEAGRKVDHNQHIENMKAIAELQGQIKVYKELPLEGIANSMQEITKANKDFARTNKLILKTLENSALILADDKAKLVAGRRQTDKLKTMGDMA